MNREIDIDKIFDDLQTLKPITKGLGFHHKEKTISLAEKSELLKQDFNKVALDRGDLEVFYQSPDKINERVESFQKTVSSSQNIENLALKRFVSFTLDILFITSFYLITTYLMSLVINQVNYFLYIAKSSYVLFIFFYLFYFTILDKTLFGTLGKKVFKIKVLDSRNETPTMGQTFLRSTLTFLGVITLGLTSYLDVQSKLTDTKIVENK